MIFSRKGGAIGSTTLFLRQMAAMLSSGVSLQDAFATLGSENESAKVKRLIAQISSDMYAVKMPGRKLSGYPKYFSKILDYSNSNKVNDADISKILYELADDHEKIEVFNSKLKGALHYPVILLSISFLILAVILLFVIPVFEEMFSSYGNSLPQETQFVIALSRIFKENLLIFVGLVILVPLIIKSNKRIFFTLVNVLPGYGKVAKQVAIIKFLRYLSILTTLKAPIQEAVIYSAEALDNVVYADKLKKASQSIKEAALKSNAFEQTKVFSKMALRMMDAGEKAGTFNVTLAGIATYYEKNLLSMDRLLSIFETLLMIVVGSIIGFIVIAMYMPIFKLASIV